MQPVRTIYFTCIPKEIDICQPDDFMTYSQINRDWNADPNDPQVQISVDNTCVTLDFYLNNLQFDKCREENKARIKFLNCHKYAFNTMNDEGYYMGQYRYKYTELPWGDFCKLETDWRSDFPTRHVILMNTIGDTQNHYIFFFKNNTFECVADRYELEFYKDNDTRPD